MNFFKALQLAAAICISTIACADESAPKVVTDAFEKKYPGAKAKKWEIDKNGNWEAKFTTNGEKYRADFSTSGMWIETESSLKFEDLPEAVKNAVKREFPNEEVNEVESVDKAGRGHFYDVEFKQKGPNKDVEYRKSGERVN
ncbi:PepSY-like domain-containing protein [Verrucomicrobiales bacterium]|nr:PepSY-like domain-containing protein [bacterium]MDB4617635.1 PepSY-like domain-containing protein [Verrucomicrobiales bacterium]MDB4657696.1 PepSY-like domain-containing protein [Verrucomicrobiales bacterium]MDB4662746.1 PepSY-like domain-containing protein [Verrucomicrobiales bacterium]